MSLPNYRVRRWLLAIAGLFVAVISGMYFYARLRVRNVLKEVPNKIGINIKQTATGFQFSKSDGKRTLFTIEASKLKQFKLDGRAELHNVSIVVYGRDSSRFDQIYGDDFTYDKRSGNVTAEGTVQIDLQANPSGEAEPDQSTPKELKDPIHLKTSDLVFNQQSGDAHTDARVDFQTPQASGWAVGVSYAAKSNTLTLESQIHVALQNNENLFATHGQITRDPRVIVLENPRLERTSGTVQAEQATFFLGPDNNVERVIGKGNVDAESSAQSTEQIHTRANEGEVLLTGKQERLETATLTGDVHVERLGSQPMQADAGRAILDFSADNQLRKIHAEDGVRLAQKGAREAAAANQNAANQSGSPSQDFDVSAPVIDFFVAAGNHLDHAVTSGPARITISPAQSSTAAAGETNQTAAQRTIVTAARFVAKFAESRPTASGAKGSSRLASIHGAPDAKIVNSAPGTPDRVSTSESLDVTFLPEGGISSIIQRGSVAYTDNQPASKRTQAWAETAAYNPASNILVLSGNPRVTDGGMATTAKTIRINRLTNEALAEGDVKSTYNELKEQPNGALLASSSPIHVTGASMTARGSTTVALYQGNARLWQDANVITAPSIQFDRDHRSLLAQGTSRQPVSTVLVQADQPEKEKSNARSIPLSESKAKKHATSDMPEVVAITSARLTYTDAERQAHYEGGVTAKGTDFSATADTADAYLAPRYQTYSNQPLAGAGRLQRLVANGNVLIQQPGRKAEGQKLVYTSADEKFVLTGGPPSIFDAERGKITGVSLTFFQADDRVLVEGGASTPVVTQTRVAR
ncbi:MAG TPA: LptA/OstA family protein [Candidatus Aquilonibacter sp.]|nr:LptA/OstA family protein [Candidatus Aquilonibacter sp.]